jgi:large subunit ribosomal protein L4
MKTDIYNQKGEKAGSVELSESVFGLPWNSDLVHQVMVSMQSNARIAIAHTKDRSEVSGGGAKPWRQKGTGRARHGSRRSPIWIGGGVTFGPRNERNFAKKINKKMRAKAFYTVLSEKNRGGEILFVDTLETGEIKTKKAKEILASLGGISGFDGLVTKKNNAAFIALGERDENTEKSFRNFGNVKVGDISSLNLLNILKYKYLIITKPKESTTLISKRLNKPETIAKV